MHLCTLKYSPEIENLECVHQGVDTEIYTLPGRPNRYLSIATDRVSTHNVVHESTIAQKGAMMTALVVFLVRRVLRNKKTNLISWGKNIYDYLPPGEYSDNLHLRATVFKKIPKIAMKFTFHSKLADTLWSDFYSKGIPDPYGINLPSGLVYMSPIEPPAFTPTENSEAHCSATIMEQHTKAYVLAASTYGAVQKCARECGIEIVNATLTIGMCNGEVTIMSEHLTSECFSFVDMRRKNTQSSEPKWLDQNFLAKEAEKKWGGRARVPLTFTDKAREDMTGRYLRLMDRLASHSLASFQPQSIF